MRFILSALFIASVFVVTAHAQVGDPTLRTDHPQYAGEGAFQTAADCVKFAVGDKQLGEQERALAIYNWLLTHQWHLLSPQENCLAGKQADAAKTQEDLIVYDAAKARFSYGYGLCGTVHAWNEPYWKAAGFDARRRAFPGHTNSEIFYGNAWHAFDTDMAGLLFRKDGIVAGYADIIADPSLATSVKPPYPHYPFAWPSDFTSMKNGWQEVAKNPNKWFAMYNGGYECQPGIVNLRKGETFTRWFDPDHYGGPTKRRFWHHQKNGPTRDWTFANNGEPRHDGNNHNARGNAAYCNGEFVWETDEFGPIDNNGKIVSHFTHWSPYVICGDPDDDANPMTGRATGGLIVEGKTDAEVQISLCLDGYGYDKVAVGKLPLDLTEHVKGRYGWSLALTVDGSAKLKQLRFTTTTQINPAIYPRLKSGGCTVQYRAANRAAVDASPNLFLDPSFIPEIEPNHSVNLAWRDRTKSRVAYQTTNNKPATVEFRVASLPHQRHRHPLQEICAAIRYQVRVPPPEKADYRLEISTDSRRTWQKMAVAEIPQDNEFSSGWLYGSFDISRDKQADKFDSAVVRATLYAGGHQTGLIEAQLYGIQEMPRPGEVELTYGWKENGELKTASQRIPAGATEQSWKIATGEKIRDEFVRLSAN